MSSTETARSRAGKGSAGYARADVLVDSEWLEQHLRDPGVCVIEVDVSPAAYEAGHIDGAVCWNIYRDLKDASYHFVDEAAIQRLFARSGISPSSTVVFYGYAPAMGFWLMKLYGHADVRVLDDTRDGWNDAGRPWTSVPTDQRRGHYELPPRDERVRAQLPEVRAAIANPNVTVVDVRSDAEFRGERFWPSGGLEEGGRAGRIPSAVHNPIDAVLDETGRFKSAPELREQFAAIDVAGHGALVTYCTIGARAATAWFVLTYLLGRDGVCVYDGSWAEWGRTADLPVENDEHEEI
jgi:thiosulfate/3-mercaptopyruvate sulfurtransferase